MSPPPCRGSVYNQNVRRSDFCRRSQTMDRTLDKSTRGGPPWICGQHSVRTTVRIISRQNTIKGHTPVPGWRLKSLTQEGIESGRAGFKGRDSSDHASATDYRKNSWWLVGEGENEAGRAPCAPPLISAHYSSSTQRWSLNKCASEERNIEEVRHEIKVSNHSATRLVQKPNEGHCLLSVDMETTPSCQTGTCKTCWRVITLLWLEPGFPCKCMLLYKLVTLLKLCKYSFHDLTTPNIDTFSVYVCIFWPFWEYIHA